MASGLRTLRGGSFLPPTPPVKEPNYYSYFFSPLPPAERQPTIAPPADSLFDLVRGWLTADQPSDLDVSEQSARPGLMVRFADVAGEQYLSPGAEPELWDDLARSKALLCFLDPDDRDHFEIAINLVSTLWLKAQDSVGSNVTRRLSQYVAVCFSKIDQPEYLPFAHAPEDLARQVAERTGFDLGEVLRRYFLPSRVRFFCVSAVGADAVGSDGRLKTGAHLRPINLLEPLRWLFRSIA